MIRFARLTHSPQRGSPSFDIEITPDLLAELRAHVVELFDVPSLDAAHRKRLLHAGSREYSWVNRPEIPLVLQAVRDYDSWVAALQRCEEPVNLGALGPFVRLGLALRLARQTQGGDKRLEELRRLAAADDFDQLANKAFELEVAFYFAHDSARKAVEFGPLGGKPDLWLGLPPRRLPVECKVVSGGGKPSAKCMHVWRRFIIGCVKSMKRLGVSAGVCVRALDNFDEGAFDTLRSLADDVLGELARQPNESWALRSADNGHFLVYGVKLSKWGEPRPPFTVPLGLDGDLTVWTQYDSVKHQLTSPYFFALKFQTPTIRQDSIVANVRAAASQLADTHPQGPGLAVLKVSGLRMGDLFDADRVIRRELSKRRQVSAVLLLWDETSSLGGPQALADGTRRWGFTLKPYVMVNESAAVAIGWPDSGPQFFPTPPVSVLRSETGELIPFDFQEEQRLLDSGTVLTGGPGGSPLLLNARDGVLPPFPHIVLEAPDTAEGQGRMTFCFRFRKNITDDLLAANVDKVVLEWFVVGKTHFRVYRDRDLNLRVNRRTREYQDNVAIDLVPFGDADELLLQLVWGPNDIVASLRRSDDYPPAVCRSARSLLS